MNKQKLQSPTPPLRNKQKDDDTQTYATQLYRQRPIKSPFTLIAPQKIKSNPSFSLDKISTRSLQIAKTSLLPPSKKQLIKLPSIKKQSNPEISEQTYDKFKDKQQNKTYYQNNLFRCLKKHQTTYMMNLYRQHFYQCIQVLRFGQSIKIPHPRKEIRLARKGNMKTIFLDLDQTLIHCDQTSNNYTVKLNFPLQKGGTLAAGVRVRPYCAQFLQKLSQIAEIIIFTASSASYADVVLDYLDPQKKLISHRLYRQHCTLQKGYYLKDLRIVNRSLKEVVLVDNSPYCHILQPQNAVPIVPFYHFSKDRQLQHLLEFLRIILMADDARSVIAQTFFWQKYIHETGEPRKIFLKHYQKKQGKTQ